MFLTETKICPSCNQPIELDIDYIQNDMPDDWVCVSCLKEKAKKTGPQEIIIRPEALDLSNLDNDNHNDILWRPSNFDEYKGQENLKQILKAYINGCKQRGKKFPHTMITGSAGTGKTTISYIIAKQLNLPFVEAVTNTIQSPQQFVDKLIDCQGGVLFLDEIHEINRKVANFILPLLEDFSINGKKIKPFTLITATTEKGVLIKKYKPLVDRMKIQKTLEPYKEEDLIHIIEQYKNKTFPDINISKEVLYKLAHNAKRTPRIALRYLESYVYMNQNIDEVFKSYGIVKDGLNKEDIQVLRLLKKNEKGLGIKAISASIGTSEQNYMYEIENYLLQEGYITITSRRVITEKGKEFLKCLN